MRISSLSIKGEAEDLESRNLLPADKKGLLQDNTNCNKDADGGRHGGCSSLSEELEAEPLTFVKTEQLGEVGMEGDCEVQGVSDQLPGSRIDPDLGVDKKLEGSRETVELGNGQTGLVGRAECRICQDEDVVTNLDSPCACAGSLKYAHRDCLQHWCNEKGNTLCEICHQPYVGNYSVPAVPSSRQLLTPEEIPAQLRQELLLPFGRRSVLPQDSRVYAVRDGEHLYLEVEYGEHSPSAPSTSAWCRAAALILVAILLLRHAFTFMSNTDDDGTDVATLLFLRIAGILLPCFIMARALSLLQQQPVEEGPIHLTAAEASNIFLVQSGDLEDPELSRPASPEAPLVQNQA